MIVDKIERYIENIIHGISSIETLINNYEIVLDENSVILDLFFEEFYFLGNKCTSKNDVDYVESTIESNFREIFENVEIYITIDIFNLIINIIFHDESIEELYTKSILYHRNCLINKIYNENI